MRMSTAERRVSADPVGSLVGRDVEIARVEEAVRPPYREELAILIEGPAGIGKTSLLRAGVALAEAAGVTVLQARPVEAEATYAYATPRPRRSPRRRRRSLDWPATASPRVT